MVGRAKSQATKLRLSHTAHDNLMARAVAAYTLELAKPYGKLRKGARKICKDFERLYLQETGDPIKLSFSTLTRLANGGKTQVQSNSERSWLSPEETNVVLEYIIETGDRGFPLSHRRLKEHVDEICRARLGTKFRAEGVGKQWTHRFIVKHSDKIKMSWASSLESKRGRAVNPNTNKAYFELLHETITKYAVTADNTYAVNEVGIHGALGQKERVVGSHKTGPQYQQRDGDRENITVLVNICADGSSTPPAVIFKGNAYQVKWQQNNPANAL